MPLLKSRVLITNRKVRERVASDIRNHLTPEKIHMGNPTIGNLPGPLVRRVVTIGGISKAQLLAQLAAAHVKLNVVAVTLIASDLFTVEDTNRSVVTVELSVEQLGFPQGATLLELFERALSLGLTLSPLELGPHLRLQYHDQPEGFWDQPVTEHQAPPGSVQIASAPLSGDDEFPKGFYLRRIKGELWLRGYWDDLGHTYQPGDRFVFSVPPS